MPFTAPDADFEDKPRGCPPKALTDKDERAVMRFLEKDKVRIVKKAVEKFDISSQLCEELVTNSVERCHAISRSNSGCDENCPRTQFIASEMGGTLG